MIKNKIEKANITNEIRLVYSKSSIYLHGWSQFTYVVGKMM